MGQLSIQYDTLKNKFSIANFFIGDRSLVRHAKRAVERHLERDIKGEQAEIVALNEAIRKFEVDSVEKHFKSYCDASVKEFDEYVTTLNDMMILLNQEFTRLKKVYAESDKVNPVLRQRIKRDYDTAKKHAESWLGSFQSANSLTFHYSDTISLKQEVRHLLDMFTIQPKVKAIQRHEKKLKAMEAKVEKFAGTNSAKLSEQQKALLKEMDAMDADLEKYLALLDKVFVDVLKIMMLEQQAHSQRLDAYLKKLTELAYMPSYLAKVKINATKAKSEYSDSFKKLNEATVGLTRIMQAI